MYLVLFDRILRIRQKIFESRRKIHPLRQEAALPVYIVHLPLVVIVGFYVIQFDLPIAVKYFVIIILSLFLSVLLYEIAVKRFNFSRVLMGLKKRI